MEEAFDTLLDAYEEIEENIPQFEKYRELFKKPRMQELLQLVYEDILEFHRNALGVFRRRGTCRES